MKGMLLPLSIFVTLSCSQTLRKLSDCLYENLLGWAKKEWYLKQGVSSGQSNGALSRKEWR